MKKVIFMLSLLSLPCLKAQTPSEVKNEVAMTISVHNELAEPIYPFVSVEFTFEHGPTSYIKEKGTEIPVPKDRTEFINVFKKCKPWQGALISQGVTGLRYGILRQLPEKDKEKSLFIIKGDTHVEAS